MSYKVLQTLSVSVYHHGYFIVNGYPDCRMQKHYTHDGWVDEYLFDNQMQMTTAMEDYDYSCWLANDPAYKKDVVKNPYPNR